MRAYLQRCVYTTCKIKRENCILIIEVYEYSSCFHLQLQNFLIMLVHIDHKHGMQTYVFYPAYINKSFIFFALETDLVIGTVSVFYMLQ
jgi:hypothetical protein